MYNNWNLPRLTFPSIICTICYCMVSVLNPKASKLLDTGFDLYEKKQAKS